MSSARAPSGRLELTWTNKHLSLLSSEDGGYEWVEPGDYRAREVRLLQEQATATDPQGRSGPSGLLIQGDSLNALRSLARIPEYAKRYRGKVKLCYIDPPFNTGQAFTHYDDALEHSVWLGMMRERLIAIKELLAPDGSVWVHLDDAEMAYCKVLMDEVFGRDNFVTTIVWQRRDSRSNDAVVSRAHDVLLIYAANFASFKASRNLQPREAKQLAAYTNPDDDPRGLWRAGDPTAPDTRDEAPERWYPVTRPIDGKAIWPKPHRIWALKRETMRRLAKENRLWWGNAGTRNLPMFKRFLVDVKDGVTPMSWWPFNEVGSTRIGKYELKALFPGEIPFSTPKPERLLQRIIHIGSNPGDIVLDCFAGSGTTAAVAHKMGRDWVTVELSADTVRDFTAPRLRKVVAGEDPGGITEAVGWEGGGRFRKMQVAPAMVADQDGLLVLADWARGESLERAVAAQLGFEYDPHGPFCGRLHRTRLAVVDGMADARAAEGLLAALAAGETLVLAATSVRYEVTDLLKTRAPGSRAVKIPQFLREGGRLRIQQAAAPDESPAAPDKDASEATAAPPARVLTPDPGVTIPGPGGLESAPAEPDHEEEQVGGSSSGSDGHE